MTFKEKVLKIVSKIKCGEAMSYGQVARLAGNSKASRVVGMIMKANFDPKIPCHRVIRSDGTLGGYNRGALEKKKKLKAEGYKGLV